MAELEFNPRAGHNSTPLKQEQACLALALLVIFSLARTTLFPGCRSWDWLLSPFCALSCLRLSHSWLLRLCWVQPLSVASRFCFPPICSAKCWLPVFLVNPWGGSCEFGWPCSLLSIVSIQNSLLDQWCGVCWGKEKDFSIPFGRKNCFFVRVGVANRCPFVRCHDTSWVTPLNVSRGAEL